ncbi:cation diffusion facilitator family transporter [Chloroflexota bacterium]
MFSSTSGASKLSIIVVIVLILLKVVAGAITGSLSILAQAADSFFDLFAVVVTFLAIRIATRPADEQHPFGHGKAENIAATVQAILIFLAGSSIIFAAVLRIQTGTTLELTETGMGVMLVSIIASILLSRHLLRVAKSTDSLAMQANARNIAADVYSAAAVLAGLLLVRFTGLSIIDPILAILVALFIFKVGYDVLRNSFGGLVDVKLPETEENTVKLAITEHFGEEVVNFHKLRTRKAGSQRYIDLHLIMPKDTSLEEAHRLCDHLEEDMENKLSRTDVTIHVEPCDENCNWCAFTCERRKE